MSLINDALKRAKETQPAAAPAAGPDLRPVDSASRPHEVGFLLPLLVVLILALAAVLIWAWLRSAGEVNVHARSPMVETPPPVAVIAPVAPLPPAEVITNAVATPVTNNVVVEIKPKPAFKLESVFYRTKGASAVINRRLVSVGEMVDEAQVLTIDRQSVKLQTSAGEIVSLELLQ